MDIADGGYVGSRTSAEMLELYEMLGANSQQKSTRNMRRAGVAEAGANQDLAEQMSHLTRTVQKLAEKTNALCEEGRVRKVMMCTLCGDSGHEDGSVC